MSIVTGRFVFACILQNVNLLDSMMGKFKELGLIYGFSPKLMVKYLTISVSLVTFIMVVFKIWSCWPTFSFWGLLIMVWRLSEKAFFLKIVESVYLNTTLNFENTGSIGIR